MIKPSVEKEINSLKNYVRGEAGAIEKNIKAIFSLMEDWGCVYVSIDINTYKLNFEAVLRSNYPSSHNDMKACFYSLNTGREFDPVDFDFKGVERMIKEYH